MVRVSDLGLDGREFETWPAPLKTLNSHSVSLHPGVKIALGTT